ncbi:MAG: hypothetical protein OXN96_06295 [Bryobacterales bacterium]|nr:hypothetical protein [Bryobacterales bacterium]MDE0623085.1 hypothetical protein [Bryobacterales bacterium]
MAAEGVKISAASGATARLDDPFRRTGKPEVLINWEFRVSREWWLDLHRDRNE